MSTALIQVLTPTSNRRWRTDAGRPEEVLTDLGREMRRRDALELPLDAGAWLEELQSIHAEPLTEVGGSHFPPRRLLGSGIEWLYEVVLSHNGTFARLRIWGPGVDQMNPDRPDMSDFDPLTTPRRDVRWRYAWDEEVTDTGHPARLVTNLEMSDVQTLAVHLRPFLRDALAATRQEDPQGIGERARALQAALVEFGPSRPAPPAPPELPEATGQQRELMDAALERYASKAARRPEADERMRRLIPDERPLTATLIGDVETITGRPLRSKHDGAAPQPVDARVALNRWAALKS